MKKLLYCIFLLCIVSGCKQKNLEINSEKEEKMGVVTLVIHGGAGTIRKTDMTPERETAYKEVGKGA
jgi:beta-aspartyl-peptidase (threonine type)